MKTTTSVFFLALILLVGAAPSAHAAIYYPWCAVYGGMADGGTNCGFSTIEQCRATISGMGGSCEPNSFYVGPASNTRHRKRQH